MNIQNLFSKHLIRNRNMLACHEVSHYGHICDVLAVDRHKKLIFEYEFKTSSNDLKIAEFKKDKYTPYLCHYRNEIAKSSHWKNVYKPWKVPHFFYFVVPESLYEKEKEYLKSLRSGTIFYRDHSGLGAHISNMDFYVGKRTVEQKANTQNYEIALKSLAKRLSNIYAWRTENNDL